MTCRTRIIDEKSSLITAIVLEKIAKEKRYG
jgi:hypothetical protein